MSKSPGPSTHIKKVAGSKRAKAKKAKDEGNDEEGKTAKVKGEPVKRGKKEKTYVKDIVSIVHVSGEGHLTSPQDDKVAQATNTATAEATNLRRDEGCAAASLGFALIKIDSPFFELSKWNDRPLNRQALTKVVQNFFDDGCHYKRPANAIPVIVHRHEVDLASLCGPQDLPAKLRPIVWKDRAAAVQIANGRHRREGHKEYLKRLRKLLDDATNHVSSLTRANASEQELKKAIAYRDQQAAYIESLGEWIAEFYDYGKSEIIYDLVYDNFRSDCLCPQISSTSSFCSTSPKIAPSPYTTSKRMRSSSEHCSTSWRASMRTTPTRTTPIPTRTTPPPVARQGRPQRSLIAPISANFCTLRICHSRSAPSCVSARPFRNHAF